MVPKHYDVKLSWPVMKFYLTISVVLTFESSVVQIICTIQIISCFRTMMCYSELSFKCLQISCFWLGSYFILVVWFWHIFVPQICGASAFMKSGWCIFQACSSSGAKMIDFVRLAHNVFSIKKKIDLIWSLMTEAQFMPQTWEQEICLVVGICSHILDLRTSTVMFRFSRILFWEY